MFRFSILLLTLSLLAASPSVFAHDVPLPVHDKYGQAISNSQSDGSIAEANSLSNPWGATRWHFHKYTYAERKLSKDLPGAAENEVWTPTSSSAWPYASVAHKHNYENSEDYYVHSHREALIDGHSHDPVPDPSGQSGDQQQSPVQQSPPQQVETQQAIPQGAVPQPPANPQSSPQEAAPLGAVHQPPADQQGVNQQSAPQQSVQQPSGNQLPVEQQSVQQPSGNQPIVTQPTAQPVSSATPAAEPASQGQPQTSQPVSEDTPIKPITQPQQKPLITEYMLRDYSRSGGAGLPQWIEIYNGNLQEIDLKGYQFTYAQRNTANSPYRYKTETIDSFVIPAGEAKIIIGKKIEAREARWNTVAGLSDEDIWVIPSEENWVSLKDGWHLADPSGKAIYRIGGAFEEKPAAAAWDDSIAWRGNVRVPPHTSEGFRVSYQSLPSESADEDHFYGNIEDRSAVAVVVNSKTTYAFVGKSSPGFYRPVSVAPAAPSLVRPKRIGTWAGLKK